VLQQLLNYSKKTNC
jgi:hypothetical protein